MICSKCGTELNSAKFCPNCGTPAPNAACAQGDVSKEERAGQQEEGSRKSSGDVQSGSTQNGASTQSGSYVQSGANAQSSGTQNGGYAQSGSYVQSGANAQSSGTQNGGNAQSGSYVQSGANAQSSGTQNGGNAQSGSYGGGGAVPPDRTGTGVFSGNSGGNTPSPVQIFAAVFLALFVINAFQNFFRGVSYLIHLTSGYYWISGYHVGGFALGGFLSMGLSVLLTAVFALMAGLMIVMLKAWKKEDSGAYFVMSGVGAAALLLLTLLRMIIGMLFWGFGSAASFFGILFLLMLYVGGLFFLFHTIGADPLSGVSKLGASGAVQESVQTIKDLAQTVFQGNHQGNPKGAYRDMEAGNNSYTQGDGTNLPRGMVAVKSDRSLAVVILLSLVTCGIYNYLYVNAITNDINVVCAGDGKETTGIVKYIIFTFLTCGIYSLYWNYCFCNRLAENAPRYGMHFEENGTTYLLWVLFGSMLCGVGAFVALHIQIKNLNALCAAYNRANGFAA